MNFSTIPFKNSLDSEITLNDFKGNVLLIVNTATGCGLAPQLREFETLHQKYKDRGLTIIAFPSDQFKQEPETNESVAKVCNDIFGVTFLIAEKIKVNGIDTHPLFKELKKIFPNGILGKSIKWNFTKFLLARDGTPYKRYAPNVTPCSFEGDILELLNTEIDH